MSRRAELLEFAVLGLLHEAPMHGYQLRKRLNEALGMFRALSYGTLYPCLKNLSKAGLIQAEQTDGGGRARIVYALTADGKERFAELNARANADAYEDDGFELRLAFFARTEADVRIRILEGRRSRLQERLDAVKNANAANRERMDRWTSALQSRGENAAQSEVRWLSELIEAERHARPTTRVSPLTNPDHPAFTPPNPPREH